MVSQFESRCNICDGYMHCGMNPRAGRIVRSVSVLMMYAMGCYSNSSMPSASFGSRRATSIPGSVFALMDKAKKSAALEGLGIIDLSIGSSDLSPPEEIIEVTSFA